ncbi:hypothetical protein SPSYN_02543 [Sporotomaculum syntrophicum]|uniref:Uncharacterized protein n=1 Tax=Sporotomaculum syntrophicum TaxID=182264 RepID=A0A9D2WMX5_9FIRM|nr:hypothetical protein [Sporotomaculum syntrophicum]KAF1084139.1 hypothetical protein SPSYN_02543 [Sporotomaculum syntrophicum]
MSKDKNAQEMNRINREANEEAAQDYLRLKLNEIDNCDEDSK